MKSSLIEVTDARNGWSHALHQKVMPIAKGSNMITGPETLICLFTKLIHFTNIVTKNSFCGHSSPTAQGEDRAY